MARAGVLLMHIRTSTSRIILCLATVDRMHFVMLDRRQPFCLLFNFVHPVLYTPFLFLVPSAKCQLMLAHDGWLLVIIFWITIFKWPVSTILHSFSQVFSRTFSSKCKIYLDLEQFSLYFGHFNEHSLRPALKSIKMGSTVHNIIEISAWNTVCFYSLGDSVFTVMQIMSPFDFFC